MTARITVDIQQHDNTTWNIALFRDSELVTLSTVHSFEEASKEALNLLWMGTTLEKRKAGAA